MIAKKSADVNAAEADGTTPLLWAANVNDTDLVSRLLKAGANPNVRNQLGSTPLAEAALNSNTEMIQVLLDAGADPNAAGADGQTPLMLVARTANVAAAKLLARQGRERQRRRKRSAGQTALMWAAASSQGPMMRELLARGAEVDAKSATDLMTPLISKEPRAQPRPPGGMTAMLFSTREGCMDCVQGAGRERREARPAGPGGRDAVDLGDLQRAFRRRQVPDREGRERQPLGLVGTQPSVSGRRLQHAAAWRTPGSTVDR